MRWILVEFLAVLEVGIDAVARFCFGRETVGGICISGVPRFFVLQQVAAIIVAAVDVDVGRNDLAFGGIPLHSEATIQTRSKLVTISDLLPI